MGPKKKDPEAFIATPSSRVIWALKKIWAGSQTRMAAETGISQTAISNIVKGRRSPGRDLLTAIASHPLINAEWLLTGEGEALRGTGPVSVPSEPTLPMADHFLPGPVEQYRHLFRETYLPVTRHDYRTTRYWLKFESWEVADYGISKGDMLLVETDANWIHQQALPEYLCAVASIGEAAPRVQLLKYEKVSDKLTVEILAPLCAPELGGGRRKRSVDLSDQADHSVGEAPAEATPKHEPSISMTPTGELIIQIQADKSVGQACAGATPSHEPSPQKATTATLEEVPFEQVCGILVLRQARWPWPY